MDFMLMFYFQQGIVGPYDYKKEIMPYFQSDSL